MPDGVDKWSLIYNWVEYSPWSANQTPMIYGLCPYQAKVKQRFKYIVRIAAYLRSVLCKYERKTHKVLRSFFADFPCCGVLTSCKDDHVYYPSCRLILRLSPKQIAIVAVTYVCFDHVWDWIIGWYWLFVWLILLRGYHQMLNMSMSMQFFLVFLNSCTENNPTVVIGELNVAFCRFRQV